MEITKETSLHLLVTAKCNNNCPLCCNREYNLLEIPVVQVEELAKAGTLCITGGEPLIFTDQVKHLLRNYKYMVGSSNPKKVYIYTTGRNMTLDVLEDLILYWDNPLVSGFSIGPKSYQDWKQIEWLVEEHHDTMSKLNNRLYLFPEWEQTFKDINKENPDISEIFEVIPRKWQKSFKPAKNSIFRRLPILFNVGVYVRDENG